MQEQLIDGEDEEDRQLSVSALRYVILGSSPDVGKVARYLNLH